MSYRVRSMNGLREELHELVDKLPEPTLEHAKNALVYCSNPEKQRMTIEKAKQRAKENSEQHLRRLAERIGHGFISAIGSAAGQTFVDGSHHSSMIAFEDGKEATYHLYIYRGTMFEIVETIEISEDHQRLIRRERIAGVDGTEQTLTAFLPVSPIGPESTS